MYILIRFADQNPIAIIVEAVVLAQTKDRMRIAAAGFPDTIELRLSGAQWFNECGQLVEIDFLMPCAHGDARRSTPTQTGSNCASNRWSVTGRSPVSGASRFIGPRRIRLFVNFRASYRAGGFRARRRKSPTGGATQAADVLGLAARGYRYRVLTPRRPLALS